MTKELLIATLSPKLTNFSYNEEIKQVRAEYLYKDSKVAIYYFDYEENDLSFNLDDYLEKNISADYYNNPGPIQWNNYLCFIREQGIISVERKRSVENNDIYTRKFVFTPGELEQYLKYKKTTTRVEIDLVSKWKEELRQADLDEVFGTEPYTQAVPRFIAGQVIKDINTDQALAPQQSAEPVNNISYLTFNTDYRLFPQQKSFALKKVNLVKGANGVGKTSFLDAIELVIAGKSGSDPSAIVPANCIQAQYNGDDTQTDFIQPANNAKYRNRDLAWYSNPYKTGNELHRNFRRNNYFDADAAYKLSYEVDIKSISSYLSSIMLGAEFTRVQDKMKGFKERFTTELQNRQNIVNDERRRRQEAQDSLEKGKNADTPDSFYQLFLSIAKEIQWVPVLPDKTGDVVNTFESDYRKADACINSINRLLTTIQLRNIGSLLAEKKRYQDAYSNFLQIKTRLDQTAERLRKLEDAQRTTAANLNLLQSAEKYYADSNNFAIEGLSERMTSNLALLNRLKSIASGFDALYGSPVLQKTAIISHEWELAKSKRDSLQQDLLQLNVKTDELKKSIGELHSVISDIKALGRKLLDLEPEATTCPMCQAGYFNDDLIRKINEVNVELSENKVLQVLNDQKHGLEFDIQNLEAEIGGYETATNIINLLGADITAYTAADLINSVGQSRIRMEEISAAQNAMNNLAASAQTNQLNELDFMDIRAALKEHFPDLLFAYDSLADFNLLMRQHREKFEQTSFSIAAEQKLQAQITGEIQQSVAGVMSMTSIEDTANQLSYRLGIIEEALINFNGLKEYLVIGDNEDIAGIEQKLSRLYTSYQSYQQAIIEFGQLEIANGIIRSADIKINALTPEVNRLALAVQLLSTILARDAETIVLQKFLQENESDIQQIFQSIHAPKEFSAIIFGYNNNTVKLQRVGQTEPDPLTKISTGQRSALALSIFLALNKKLNNGPNLILMDDPISYVDDLNVLSFLDYMREMVINDDRQVFFATANKKLAGLFEKKFSFLKNDNDFEVFNFERLAN